MAKAVVGAVEGDPKDRDALRRIGEQTGELEPAAQARARRQAVMQHVWLKCLQPLGRLTGIPKEYFDFKFAEDMAEKLKDVPEDDLIPPKGSLAGPAIQGLGFTVEEPELREMYLNLIATASDRRVASTAHPSFAGVIQQLNADEASALIPVLAATTHPIVEIRAMSSIPGHPEGYVVIARHVLNWMGRGGDEPESVLRQVAVPERAVFVDNWIRLGLVEVDYTTALTKKGRYDWCETAPLVLEARESFRGIEGRTVECQHGILTVTDYGTAFRRAVMGTQRSIEAGTGSEADKP